MKTLLVKWIVSAVAIFLVARYYPGLTVASFETALWMAFILGLLNALIKPILFILTLPITILTLGLFAVVLNGAMLILATKFVEGVAVNGLLSAIIASFLISVVSTIGNKLLMGLNEKAD